MTAREAVTGTQDVLDKMTASIMNKKTEAKTALTPVGMEVHDAATVLPRTAASFPNDHPQEVVLAAVAEIRRQIVAISDALAAVEASLQEATVAPVADPAAAQKAKEKAADARVAANAALAVEAALAATPAEIAEEGPQIAAVLANLDAKSVAAQAATFAAAAGPVGWQCPVHHAAAERTSRKGRKFQACPNYPDGCGEFEKLA